MLKHFFRLIYSSLAITQPVVCTAGYVNKTVLSVAV